MDDELSALEGEGPCAFGVNPVEADHNSDPAKRQIKNRKTKISRGKKEVLSIIEVNLSIDPDNPGWACQNRRIVNPIGSLGKTISDEALLLPCEFSDRLKCGSRGRLGKLIRFAPIGEVIARIKKFGKDVEICPGPPHQVQCPGYVGGNLPEDRVCLDDRYAHPRLPRIVRSRSSPR